MSFTETTTTSWFARMKGAVAKIFFGLFLLVAAIVLLFWNEGRAIKTYRALAEGAGLVVSIDGSSIDPANDGKLVHISGAVKPIGTPQDDVYGIVADNALRISREVQMYQWVEKSESKSETKLGGSEETVTTYSYSKEWRDDVVDSSRFKQQDGHDNPERLVDSTNFTVDQAMVGAFAMKGQDVAPLGDGKPISLNGDDAQRFEDALGGARSVRAEGGRLYVGNNSRAPEVGDLRIAYERIDLTQASFVGAQRGDTLVGYKTSNGRDLFLSAAGNPTAAEMFETAQSENTIITWIVRVGGMVALFVGFACIFSILGVAGDLIPFVGSMVRFGTSLAAFVLTIVIGPIVIAIGWIAYRPLLAIGIIVAGIAIAVVLVRLRRKPPATVPLGRPAA